jgi:hypothetical protein
VAAGAGHAGRAGPVGAAPAGAVADAGYGEVGGFRQGLDDRQIPYVVQVKADTSANPAPRIHAELRLGLDVHVGRKRVARLMRGLQGVHRRRRGGSTRRDPTASPAPDLVERNFNRLGRTGCGWLTSPSSAPARAGCTWR